MTIKTLPNLYADGVKLINMTLLEFDLDLVFDLVHCLGHSCHCYRGSQGLQYVIFMCVSSLCWFSLSSVWRVWFPFLLIPELDNTFRGWGLGFKYMCLLMWAHVFVCFVVHIHSKELSYFPVHQHHDFLLQPIQTNTSLFADENKYWWNQIRKRIFDIWA